MLCHSFVLHSGWYLLLGAQFCKHFSSNVALLVSVERCTWWLVLPEICPWGRWTLLLIKVENCLLKKKSLLGVGSSPPNFKILYLTMQSVRGITQNRCKIWIFSTNCFWMSLVMIDFVLKLKFISILPIKKFSHHANELAAGKMTIWWPWTSTVLLWPRRPMAFWGVLEGLWLVGQERISSPSTQPWWAYI